MRKASFGLMLLLAGCVQQPGIKPLRPLDIPTAAYQAVVTAALSGTLMYESNCLLFRDDTNGAILLPVWPTGSTFNGTSLIFHEPGKAEQRVMVAESFLMSGQPLQWATLGAPTYQPFQRQCGAQPFFVSKVRPAN